MDYRGQRICEYIYAILTIFLGAIAWIVGYIKGDFQLTFYGWAIGLGLSLIVCKLYSYFCVILNLRFLIFLCQFYSLL
jgi:hypothetical protein